MTSKPFRLILTDGTRSPPLRASQTRSHPAAQARRRSSTFGPKTLSRCAAIVLGMCLAGIWPTPSAATAAERSTRAEQRPIAADGAWSWSGDPRGVYHDGMHRRTYVGWVSSIGDIGVSSYDHDTRFLAATVISPAFQADDHNNPSLYVRRDGRLTAFWSGHPNGSEMLYRTSTRAEDISEWGPTRAVGVNTPGRHGYTYPNPIRLDGENRLYLFWRGGNFQPSFSTSEDDGETWAEARTLIESQGVLSRPYVKYATNGLDTIHMAFTEDHPANRDTSIHYVGYRAGRFFRADGTVVGSVPDLPLLPARADKIYDAAGHSAGAWVHDVAADREGRPVIVHANFPDTRRDHRYRYARWTGESWLDRELTPAGPRISNRGGPYFSGGIALDHEDPSTVYLSKAIDGIFEIERWRTPDAGTTWATESVTSRSTQNNLRPFSPRGLPAGQDDMDVIWMRGFYRSWKSFRTSLISRFSAEDGVPNPGSG